MIVVMMLLAVVLIVSGSQIQQLPIPYAEVVIGFLLSVLLDLFVKAYGVYYIPRKYLNVSKDSFAIRFLFSVWLSSGYTFAKIIKTMIVPFREQQTCTVDDRCSCVKHLKGMFISRSNLGNLFLSVLILVLLTVMEFCGFELQQVPYGEVIIAAVIFRVISRSFEITYAFTKDVLSKNKEANSDLDKYDRVRLALCSYIENVLNFGAVYYIFSSVNSNLEANVGTSVLESIGTATISRVHQSDCYFESALVNLQVVTTLALVVLSLATYLSREQ